MFNPVNLIQRIRYGLWLVSQQEMRRNKRRPLLSLELANEDLKFEDIIFLCAKKGTPYWEIGDLAQSLFMRSGRNGTLTVADAIDLYLASGSDQAANLRS